MKIQAKSKLSFNVLNKVPVFMFALCGASGGKQKLGEKQGLFLSCFNRPVPHARTREVNAPYSNVQVCGKRRMNRRRCRPAGSQTQAQHGGRGVRLTCLFYIKLQRDGLKGYPYPQIYPQTMLKKAAQRLSTRRPKIDSYALANAKYRAGYV